MVRPSWSSLTTNSTPCRPRSRSRARNAFHLLRLSAGEFDAEDVAAAVPADADGDQHRLRADDAAVAHLLVAGVEDEVRHRFVELALGEGGERLVEALVDPRDGRRRDAVAAQLLGDRLDLACRDALDVHLRQGAHQRLLGALVTFEQLGGEASFAVAGDAQLELADAGHETARIVAGAVAEPVRRAFPGGGGQRSRHLLLQDLLQEVLEQETKPVPPVVLEKAFQFYDCGFTLGVGGHRRVLPMVVVT